MPVGKLSIHYSNLARGYEDGDDVNGGIYNIELRYCLSISMHPGCFVSSF